MTTDGAVLLHTRVGPCTPPLKLKPRLRFLQISPYFSIGVVVALYTTMSVVLSGAPFSLPVGSLHKQTAVHGWRSCFVHTPVSSGNAQLAHTHTHTVMPPVQAERYRTPALHRWIYLHEVQTANHPWVTCDSQLVWCLTS